MDLLLDINVAVDSCTGRKPWCDHVDLAIIKCRSNGGRLWLYSGSVQTLEYVTRQELLRNLPDDVPSPSARQLEKQARNLLEKFTADKQWLAALADEGSVFASPDPEDEQLIRALGRFTPGSIKLLTRDEALGARYPELTITPLQYLQTPMSVKPIAFIDLKTQQDQLRPQLEKNIHHVLHHGKYIMGPEIKELEAGLADYVGIKHAITVASGTDSLEIALRALEIGPGDEVITVPFTWISSAEVICQVGARPVFVDIDPATFNMNVDLLEAAITPPHQGDYAGEPFWPDGGLREDQRHRSSPRQYSGNRRRRPKLWRHPERTAQLRGNLHRLHQFFPGQTPWLLWRRRGAVYK